MMRPDFGHVKDVPSVCLSFLRIHNLDIKSPGWVITFFYGVVQVIHMVIGVLTSQPDSFFCGQILNACVGFIDPFNVFEGAVLRL